MTIKRHHIAVVLFSVLLSVLCIASCLWNIPTAYAAEGEVTQLSLSSDHTEENTAFYLPNLLPGDSATGYYSLSVSYTGTIQVCFAIECPQGDALLAEALTVRVICGNTGETLYEGRVGDMPVLYQQLSTTESAKTEQLSYAITVSLPTSAGNEYQNKQLIADFTWWAEYTPADPEDPDNPGGGLVPPPVTGDTSNWLFWLILAIVALIVIAAVLCSDRCSKGKARFLSVLIVLGLLICGMGITTAALAYYKQTVEDNFFQTGTVKINLNDNQPTHAFSGTTIKEKLITIQIQQEDGVLHIFIRDNGRGMDDETLQRIHRMLSDPNFSESGDSVGLLNVHKRISCIFGNPYGLKVKQESPGTCVHISYPITQPVNTSAEVKKF